MILNRRLQDIFFDFNMYSAEELKDEFDTVVNNLVSFQEETVL